MSLKSNRISCLGISLCLLWALAVSADNPVSDSTVNMVERSKGIVTQSVFRVSGKKYNGTGFLHKSGVVITAAHLVAGGDTNSVKILSPRMETFTITNMVLDTLLDMAILWPAKPISAPAFPLHGLFNALPDEVQDVLESEKTSGFTDLRWASGNRKRRNAMCIADT